MTRKTILFISQMFLCVSTCCAGQHDTKAIDTNKDSEKDSKKGQTKIQEKSIASFAMQYNMSKDIKTPVEKQIEDFRQHCCSQKKQDEECKTFMALYEFNCDEKKDKE